MNSIKKITKKEKISKGIEKVKGNRKMRAAKARKEAHKDEIRAILRNYPTSPRKMRYVADVIRGKKVSFAMSFLRLSNKSVSRPLLKLLISAINNFDQKFGENKYSIDDLFIKKITVDGGAVLKRIRPAPQGRAYQVKKRSNHVILILESTKIVNREVVPSEEIATKSLNSD